jgi:hypothetical protein
MGLSQPTSPLNMSIYLSAVDGMDSLVEPFSMEEIDNIFK